MNLTLLEIETLVHFLATTRNAFAVHCEEFGADATTIAGKLAVAHAHAVEDKSKP